MPRQFDFNHVGHLVDVFLNGRASDQPVVEEDAGPRRIGGDGDGDLEHAGDVQDVGAVAVRVSGRLRQGIRIDGKLLAQQSLPFAFLVQPCQVGRDAVLREQGHVLLRVARFRLFPLHLVIPLLLVLLQELVEQGGGEGALRHVARFRGQVCHALRILPRLAVRGGVVLLQHAAQGQRGASLDGARLLLVREARFLDGIRHGSAGGQFNGAVGRFIQVIAVRIINGRSRRGAGHQHVPGPGFLLRGGGVRVLADVRGWFFRKMLAAVEPQGTPVRGESSGYGRGQQLEGAPELAALLFLMKAEAGGHFISPEGVYFLRQLFRGINGALLHAGFRRLADDGIERLPLLTHGAFRQIIRKFGEIHAVLPRADLI